MYIEKLWHLPNGVSLPGISVDEVRGKDYTHWPGDVLVDPKSFRIQLLEECPWLPSEGPGGMECLRLLRILLIVSTMRERKHFLEFWELDELLFPMLMTVRGNNVDWSCCAVQMHPRRPSALRILTQSCPPASTENTAGSAREVAETDEPSTSPPMPARLVTTLATFGTAADPTPSFALSSAFLVPSLSAYSQHEI
jgi:hypothetical protein